MLEFTGERVIPEVADPDLLNEHRARYRFAARFLTRFGNAAVLDAGCGTGYGSAELRPAAASVTAMDISADAVEYAREQYGRPGVRFLQGACEALPFADGSFDLVTAFEVIEHLERWPQMLCEIRRVLKPSGVLLVSTPNREYYAESRAAAGPNPFHVREFDYEEYRAALGERFPHVALWSQNHVDSIAFAPDSPARGILDASGGNAPETAHFFLAACSMSPIGETEMFAYLPSTGNILRARERHIALLREELEQKSVWLGQLERKHEELNRVHTELFVELEQHNRWAEELSGELKESNGRVTELQAEFAAVHVGYQAQLAKLQTELQTTHAGYQTQLAKLQAELQAAHAGYQAQIAGVQAEMAAAHAGYQAQFAEMEREGRTRLDWIRSLESQVVGASDEIERLNTAWQERTARVESLAGELSVANAKLATIEEAPWTRLGRTLRMAPNPETDVDDR